MRRECSACSIPAASLRAAIAVSTWLAFSAPGVCETPPPTDPVPAAPTPAAPSEPTEQLKLAHDQSTRLALAVMIDGNGPYDFLVDTGADRTVISRELAAALALPPGRPVLMHEISGSDKVSTVTIDRLTIGARSIAHVEAPALAAKDIGADGMLGVDALRDLHLVMDFKSMRLASSPSRSERSDDHTIVVVGQSRYGQLVLTNSKIRGVRVLVVLDSGSQVSIGNAALLNLLTGHGTGHNEVMTTQLVDVSGRHVSVELDDVAEAQVGGVTIRNMPIAFAQLPVFNRFGLTTQPALLLGMDVLSLCRKVTVDLRRREATFTLN